MKSFGGLPFLTYNANTPFLEHIVVEGDLIGEKIIKNLPEFYSTPYNVMS